MGSRLGVGVEHLAVEEQRSSPSSGSLEVWAVQRLGEEAVVEEEGVEEHKEC